MGKRERRRRAARARTQRDRDATRRAASDGRPDDAGHESLGTEGRAAFLAAIHADRVGDRRAFDAALHSLASMHRPGVAALIQEMLETSVTQLWDAGWQPADGVRFAGRRLGAAECAVLRCVLAADAIGYASLGHPVAPAWMAQLAAADATPWWRPDAPYLLQLEGAWPTVVAAAARLTSVLFTAPPLPRLAPSPAEWHEGMTAAPTDLPSGLLDKVRALLAKAEATTFDAEAEAFTAKAQELMTRHRIDRALLAARAPTSGDEPVGRRLGTDDPYAEARALLLAEIAEANGGRSVWSKAMGFATVFGFADELDAIEELYTSLLVQATAALQREGSKQDGYGRSRTTRFRRSFLVAFAHRIGERLRESADEVVGAAVAASGSGPRSGPTILPILAARDASVRNAAERAFPDSRTFSPSVTDAQGWAAGRLFGDVADVGIEPPLDERAVS